MAQMVSRSWEGSTQQPSCSSTLRDSCNASAERALRRCPGENRMARLTWGSPDRNSACTYLHTCAPACDCRASGSRGRDWCMTRLGQHHVSSHAQSERAGGQNEAWHPTLLLGCDHFLRPQATHTHTHTHTDGVACAWLLPGRAILTSRQAQRGCSRAPGCRLCRVQPAVPARPAARGPPDPASCRCRMGGAAGRHKPP